MRAETITLLLTVLAGSALAAPTPGWKNTIARREAEPSRNDGLHFAAIEARSEQQNEAEDDDGGDKAIIEKRRLLLRRTKPAQAKPVDTKPSGTGLQKVEQAIEKLTGNNNKKPGGTGSNRKRQLERRGGTGQLMGKPSTAMSGTLKLVKRQFHPGAPLPPGVVIGPPPPGVAIGPPPGAFDPSLQGPPPQGLPPPVFMPGPTFMPGSFPGFAKRSEVGVEAAAAQSNPNGNGKGH
ncbi:hypothetical protein L249_5222 [Ophiocordyceps polyrhachis-furcata BCC 54312]|uniref:WH2 domain-containing protein n=1 Tax=Ophiocordyceps polyrhachis-furcata BCC 54312 TaxID=1330021 RepID=A0A367L905_9HYPO|nr:hypothetical protein L249_5222 [Ophiocordyceps polyrhachis-furcata BCC 54312]